MAAPLALVGKIGSGITKLGAAKSGIDLVSGKKQKQPPTKEEAVNFLTGNAEDPANALLEGKVEVLGKETVGANANDLGKITKAPEDPKPESTGNEDSIVDQINKINSNISAISNAMKSSADIESKYRKNLKEGLEQDIADRDKLQAKERAKNRRDSFSKKLLSGPKKVAGVAGTTAAKGLGLEALALMLGGDDPTQFNLVYPVTFIAVVIIGGAGTVLGPLFGAVFFSLIPGVLKFFLHFFGTTADQIPLHPTQIERFIFGLLLIGFLIFEPRGLWGIWFRLRNYFKAWPFSY